MKRFQERILPPLIILAILGILLVIFISLQNTQAVPNTNEQQNNLLVWLVIPVILLVVAIFILIREKRSVMNNRRNEAGDSNEINERKKAEEALRNSELRFRSVIEKGTEIIAMHDKTGKIIYISPSVEASLGYKPEDRIGKLAFENTHVEDFAAVREKIDRLMSTPGAVESGQWRQKDINGNWRWMEGVATNLLHDPSVNAVLHNFRDITEQKNFENELRISNERFEYATRATFDAIWDADLETGTTYWGNGFEVIFGQKLNSIHPGNDAWSDLLHLEDKERVLENIHRVINSKENNWSDEYRFLKANGEYAFVRDKGIVVRNEQGNAIRMIGAMQDITIAKREEQQLKLLESVITNATDSVLITEAEPIDANGPRILYVNEAFTKMTGYSKEEVIGKTPRILQGPNSDRAELDRLRRALEKWETCEIEIINYKKNGEPFWINISVAPVANKDGWYTHWIAIEKDITYRKKAEEELRQKNEEMKQLSVYLKNVREEERKYIAREVHDELGQLASALKIDIDWLNIKNPSMEDNGKMRMSHATKTIEVLIASIRKIASSLRPSVLDDFGLNVAIEWQCREFQNLNSIQCIFEPNFDDENLPMEIKTELFRMTQESLTNVMRHANADHVTVQLTEDKEKIYLRITDDGKGFDVKVKKNTLGLIGLRERAVSINGKLSVESQAGKGTTVLAVIPKR
jgi:PAS domain S-box-containing protein/LPXTG-motif cell wall-anchored protein